MQETVARIVSEHLGNERTIWIRPPRQPETARDLVVFLDAELYREHIGAAAIVEALAADREIADAWFVYVSMESMASRWVECPCHGPFAAFIAAELLPWLEQQQPRLRNATQRTLVGVSYTGLAAGFVALERPGIFQRVIAQSGSFWWNDCWLSTRTSSASEPIAMEFYLEVGARETQENVQHRADVLQRFSQIEGVRRFREALAKRGARATYFESEGAHEYAIWNKTLPAALRWALAPASS